MLASTMPMFHCGEAPNVIHERAELRGTIRSYSEELTLEIKSKFQNMAEDVCKKHSVKLDLDLNTKYPPIINTEKESQFVKEVAEQVYGKENVTEEGLPIMASEDFSFFTRFIPGAFFFPTTGRKDTDNPYLHEPTYNFDDDAIEKASELFAKLTLHRFDVKL